MVRVKSWTDRGRTAAGIRRRPHIPSTPAGGERSMKRLLRHSPSRKGIVAIACAICALAIAGSAVAAGGETPVTVKVGNLELTANGGFTPTALSKTQQTPIELKGAGGVK